MLTRQNQNAQQLPEGRIGRAVAAVLGVVLLAAIALTNWPASLQAPVTSLPEARAPQAAIFRPAGSNSMGSVYDGGAYGTLPAAPALKPAGSNSMGSVYDGGAYGVHLPLPPTLPVWAQSSSIYDGGSAVGRQPSISIPAVSNGSTIVQPSGADARGYLPGYTEYVYPELASGAQGQAQPSHQPSVSIPAVSVGSNVVQPIGVDASGLSSGYTDYVWPESLPTQKAQPSRNHALGYELPSGAKLENLPAGLTDYIRK